MSHMAPNYLSVRLTDDDKRKYEALQSHLMKAAGIDLPMAALYRVAINALLEKHKLKVK